MYGIGIDIIKVKRISKLLHNSNGSIITKILGPKERLIYYNRNKLSNICGTLFLSTRFSVKEAFSKAIGLGINWPMTWHSLQVINISYKNTTYILSDELKCIIKKKKINFYVSLSDERNYIVSFVMII